VLAVRLHDDGLKVEEIETPSPEPGEVLVRVHAGAITRGELEWPVDRLPAIPSYELSGVVVGSGDEVYALTPFDRDGVAAEYAVVPADVLAPKPLRLSHVEAAALPMGGLTAWQALFVHARLARGERVFGHGRLGRVWTDRRPACATRRLGGRGERSGSIWSSHSWRRGLRRRARGHDRRGNARRDLLHRQPDHEQLLELRTLVDAGELPAEVDSVFRSWRPGWRSSESRDAGSVARSYSRLTPTSRG